MTEVRDLKADAASLRLEPLKAIVIDARDGLNPDELAVLAVLNSPDLRAKRAAAGVSQAQVFAAGLLPDPQIAASLDIPTMMAPGISTAYTLAASLDLQALLTRSATLGAARASGRQVDLNLLWSEWGAAQQARQLAETAMADEAKATLLGQVRDRAAERYAHVQAALARGDVASQTASADLAVKLDAANLAAAAAHDAAKARRDLNALLDLKPEVIVPLAPAPDGELYPQAPLDNALKAVAARRPDLLALKAGYEAEDANLRKAILMQFPLLNVGYSRARDTSFVTTNGGSATLALPIFNGGRGTIRVERATREQLRAEYQARLDQTEGEVQSARADLAGALAQVAVLSTDTPRLAAMADRAGAAYARGDVDSQAYLALEQNALSRKADLADKRLAARLAEIALETALFIPPAAAGARP